MKNKTNRFKKKASLSGLRVMTCGSLLTPFSPGRAVMTTKVARRVHVCITGTAVMHRRAHVCNADHACDLPVWSLICIYLYFPLLWQSLVAAIEINPFLPLWRGREPDSSDVIVCHTRDRQPHLLFCNPIMTHNLCVTRAEQRTAHLLLLFQRTHFSKHGEKKNTDDWDFDYYQLLWLCQRSLWP